MKISTPDQNTMILNDSNGRAYIISGILIVIAIILSLVKFLPTNRTAGIMTCIIITIIALLIAILSKRRITTITKSAGTISIESKSLISSNIETYMIANANHVVIYELAKFNTLAPNNNQIAVPSPRISYQLRIAFTDQTQVALENFINSSKIGIDIYGIPLVLSDPSYQKELANAQKITDFLGIPLAERGFAAPINKILN